MKSNKLYTQVSKIEVPERNTVLEDESGYRIELQEKLLAEISLKWGRYTNPCKKILSFNPDRTSVVSHFRISDPAPVTNEIRKRIYGNQFVVYRETPEPYNLHLDPTNEKSCSFFEVEMSEFLFGQLFSDESDFLCSFSRHAPAYTPSLDFTAFMPPSMHAIINDMYSHSYQGRLRDLYLEVKTIELFLLQIKQLDKLNGASYIKLKKNDIESLNDIKEYLELNYDQDTSIVALSRKVGINSMKLKAGFKQLFDTTVFGYLHFIRMQEARRVLLDENISVNEVSKRIGYKYPHHFTSAFKKQFNITPSQLRK